MISLSLSFFFFPPSFNRIVLKFQYFGHLRRRVNSLENILMLGKIEGRRRGWQRKDLRQKEKRTTEDEIVGLSRTQWTWIWANSGRWWRTQKPGKLQSLGSQRLEHNWVTEQQLFRSLNLKFQYFSLSFIFTTEVIAFEIICIVLYILCLQPWSHWKLRKCSCKSQFSSVQSLSHVRLFATPMDCSTPGLIVHHQLPELAETHVHRVSDAIRPSHPLSSPSSLTFNLFQHQGLFQWVRSSHQVAKVLEFQLQHQSFQWTFRTDFL